MRGKCKKWCAAVSAVVMFSISFSQIIFASANEIPALIAWQQSEEAGSERQRKAFLPEEPSWCNVHWDSISSSRTIGTAGCSLHSVVNAIYYETGKFVNPKLFATFALNRGYRVWGQEGVGLGFFKAVADTYGSEYGMVWKSSTYDAGTALAWVRNGGVSSSNVYGHWIAIVDYDQLTQKYLILDSSNTSPRAKNIKWTDKANGIAWLTASQLSAGGANGYYGINGRSSQLYSYTASDFEILEGDGNHDGNITVEDAETVLKYSQFT